jgi:hypothetical protein
MNVFLTLKHRKKNEMRTNIFDAFSAPTESFIRHSRYTAEHPVVLYYQLLIPISI